MSQLDSVKKIKNQALDWAIRNSYWKAAGLSFLLGCVAAYAAYSFLISGWRSDNEARETKAVAAEKQNNHDEQLKLLMPGFLSSFKKMIGDFHDAEPLLPSEAELAQVLSQVQESARRNNVSLAGLNAVKQSVKTPGSETINEREFPSQVTGNFQNIVHFFNDVARMPRILVVRDFSVVSLKDGKASTNFTLVAFHATPGVLPAIPDFDEKTSIARINENVK